MIEQKLPEMNNSVQSRAKSHTFSRLTRGESDIPFLGQFWDLEPSLWRMGPRFSQRILQASRHGIQTMIPFHTAIGTQEH
jgi:hypothetical protein